jgi:hypothetical protein
VMVMAFTVAAMMMFARFRFGPGGTAT